MEINTNFFSPKFDVNFFRLPLFSGESRFLVEDDGVCPTLYFWLHDVSVEDALLLSVRGLEFSEKLVNGQYCSSMSNKDLDPFLYILTPADSINPAFLCGGHWAISLCW